ncbi:MAG: hypothetical protein L3J28_10375 [Candidatus Polarisedimenticolaceae bacterium]|nr:hypothetical protein [Candidatus Polarisedimenticolaceae bacterium]
MSESSAFAKETLKVMPTAFAKLTKLIMAMTAVKQDSGKKTLFGKDKGAKAFSKFLALLKETLDAMVVDGVIKTSDSNEDVINTLEEKLADFATIYPDWDDGYAFANNFFGEQRQAATVAVNKVRQMR